MFTMVSSSLTAGQWTKARVTLDHHAEIARVRDWAATLSGLAAHLAEQHEADDEAAAARYRRLLETRPGDPVALAALERIASRTGDAAARSRWPRGRSIRSADGEERAALASAPRAGGDRPTTCLAPLHWPSRAGGGSWLRARGASAGAGVASARTLGEMSRCRGCGRNDRDRRAGRRRRHRTGGGEPARGWVRFTKIPRRLPARPWLSTASGRRSGRGGSPRAAIGVARRRKDWSALVAAAAALRLGTEIQELPPRFASLVYRAATIYRGAGGRRRRGNRGLRGGAGDRARLSVPRWAGLARAHHRRGSFEALEPVLSRWRRRSQSRARERAGGRGAGASKFFRRGNLDDALAAAARALSYDPANVAAIAEHARLLARTTRGEELAGALGGLGQTLADPADKAAAYRLQAETLEWQLGQPREALMVIERAVAAAGGNKVAAPPGTCPGAPLRLWGGAPRRRALTRTAQHGIYRGRRCRAGRRFISLAAAIPKPRCVRSVARWISRRRGAVLDSSLACRQSGVRATGARVRGEKLARERPIPSGQRCGERRHPRARASDGFARRCRTLALLRRVVELTRRKKRWPSRAPATAQGIGPSCFAVAAAGRGGAKRAGALLWSFATPASPPVLRRPDSDSFAPRGVRRSARAARAGAERGRERSRAGGGECRREARPKPRRARRRFGGCAPLRNQVLDYARRPMPEECLRSSPSRDRLRVLRFSSAARIDFDRGPSCPAGDRGRAQPRDGVLALARNLRARPTTARCAEAVGTDPTSVIALVRLARSSLSSAVG